MDRKSIMDFFLGMMSRIPDEEYQQRAWIIGQGPEYGDFDEFMDIFIDEFDSILKEYKLFKITDEQYRLLKSFHKQIKSFSDMDYQPNQFKHSVEWRKIMDDSKKILEAFNYKK